MSGFAGKSAYYWNVLILHSFDNSVLAYSATPGSGTGMSRIGLSNWAAGRWSYIRIKRILPSALRKSQAEPPIPHEARKYGPQIRNTKICIKAPAKSHERPENTICLMSINIELKDELIKLTKVKTLISAQANREYSKLLSKSHEWHHTSFSSQPFDLCSCQK